MSVLGLRARAGDRHVVGGGTERVKTTVESVLLFCYLLTGQHHIARIWNIFGIGYLLKSTVKMALVPILTKYILNVYYQHRFISIDFY